MAKVELANGVKLHYQTVGNGPPIVLVHGLTGNLAIWHLQIVPALMDDFQILTYDLRGHGYSSVPPSGYTHDDMADDLRQLLEHLEIDDPVIVGHSYGADIALYYALAHPERVRKVVAIEAALPCTSSERADTSWAGWGTWVDALEEAGVEVPPEKRNDLDWLLRQSLEIPKKWGPLKGLPRDTKRYLRMIDETTIGADFDHVGSLTREAVANIKVPVVAMYAEGGAFNYTHDFLMEHLPECESVMLPQTELGHFGPLEQPELVAEHIRRVAQR